MAETVSFFCQCATCGNPHPTYVCTSCWIEAYCDEICARKNVSSHKLDCEILPICSRCYRRKRCNGCAAKARAILRHGKVRGKKLTDTQRRFFGACAAEIPLKKAFSKKEAIKTAKIMGIDQEVETKYGWDQWLDGMNVELEHGTVGGPDTNITNDDPLLTARIALVHLRECETYYLCLKKMEEACEN